MHLNARQQRVVQASENKILCLAAAASGKTRVLTERIKFLIQERNVAPKDIVAITFTRMAADEMRKRLGSICKDSFIGTVHSYGNLVCALNGIDMSTAINLERFDEILKKACQISSSNFPKVKHLLIDESQDLTSLEYNFIEKIPTENIFYTGDDRQNIYQFRGGTDNYILNMSRDVSYKKYYLTQNYRNAPNILAFADDLLYSFKSVSPHSEAMKKVDGVVESCSFLEAFEFLNEDQSWGDWFLLTRTNADLLTAQEQLTENGIPNITFKRGDLDSLDELDLLLAQKSVKVLTIHSAKGLEKRNVIVVGAKTYSEEERKIAYVAATRAQSTLFWCPAFSKKRGFYSTNYAEAKRRGKSGLLDFDMIEFSGND